MNSDEDMDSRAVSGVDFELDAYEPTKLGTNLAAATLIITVHSLTGGRFKIFEKIQVLAKRPSKPQNQGRNPSDQKTRGGTNGDRFWIKRADCCL